MRTLFVALLLGEERGRALAEFVRTSFEGELAQDLRFPRSQGLHLTLFYLGPTDAEREAPLEEELALEARKQAAPELILDQGGAFPGRGRERVLWVGCGEPSGAEGRLGRLHEGVLNAVEASGFDTTDERARVFRPHITVARPKRPKVRLRVPASFFETEVGMDWKPKRLHLVESVPAEGPRIYRSRANWPLGSA